MIIPFQNILFLKECNGCFGLFTKTKKGSGTSFWCIFSAWFFPENLFYFIIYQWTKFQHHTFFSSQDIKQNVLLGYYLDSCWRHKLEDLSWIKIWRNGWQGEKEGKVEIQKTEDLKSEQSILDEIKNIFHIFWGL